MEKKFRGEIKRRIRSVICVDRSKSSYDYALIDSPLQILAPFQVVPKFISIYVVICKVPIYHFNQDTFNNNNSITNKNL